MTRKQAIKRLTDMILEQPDSVKTDIGFLAARENMLLLGAVSEVLLSTTDEQWNKIYGELRASVA